MRRAPKTLTRAGLIAITIASLALVGPVWAAATGRSVAAPRAAIKAAVVRKAAVNDPVIYLCALRGTATMGDTAGTVVPIWGFALDPNQSVGGGCSTATASLPGPVLGIDTPAITAGDAVTIHLENQDIPENVSLNIHGMTMGVPDTTGVAAGNTADYAFTADHSGTFLYEAGVDPVNEIPMGLYGGMVVNSSTAAQAYGDGNFVNGASSAYDAQRVLVLSEIDPRLNNAVDAAAPSALTADPPPFNILQKTYKPRFFLINGLSYPNTPNISATGRAGERILLRYVNAGVNQHTMMLLGAHESFVAFDNSPLTCPATGAVKPPTGFPLCPLSLDSETIPAGQTGDAIMTVPATATSGAEFAIFSRNMDLTNGLNPDVDNNPANPAYSPGGMMIFITVP
jgi:hypothetical protein